MLDNSSQITKNLILFYHATFNNNISNFSYLSMIENKIKYTPDQIPETKSYIPRHIAEATASFFTINTTHSEVKYQTSVMEGQLFDLFNAFWLVKGWSFWKKCSWSK